MFLRGSLRAVQPRSRWREIILSTKLPPPWLGPTHSPNPVVIPTSTLSTIAAPPLLPPQRTRLPPSKPQKWIMDSLGGDPDQVSEEDHPLLINAQARKAVFDHADWKELVELRKQRRRLALEKFPLERQIKEQESKLKAIMTRKRSMAAGIEGHTDDETVKVSEEEQGTEKQQKTETSHQDSAEGNPLEEAKSLKASLSTIIDSYNSSSQRIHDLLLRLPNCSHKDSPIGPEDSAHILSCYLGAAASTLSAGERAAYEAAANAQHEDAGKPFSLTQWGEKARSPSRENQPTRAAVSDHVTLASLLDPSDALDIAAGRLATGPNFPYLIGPLALLEQALLRLSLAHAMTKGFHLVSAPIMVKTDLAERCGFNPRGDVGGQTFFVYSSTSSSATQEDLCLVGTAEISLAALVAGRTFSGNELPLKLLSISPAFRAEDGGRGTQTKGLYRLRQFQKAEMYILCGVDHEYSPDHVGKAVASDSMLDELVGIQKEVMESLGLTYRCLDMPTEELGNSAYRKYDIEAWMPGRGSWGEVSSASNCLDYQSARLNILQTPPSGTLKEMKTVQPFPTHTLNATLCATPRLIVSLLEQYGVDELTHKMRLPDSLKPHWIGEVGQVNWVETGSDTWSAASHTSTATSTIDITSQMSDTISAKSQTSNQTQPPPSSVFTSQKRYYSTSPSSSPKPRLYDQLRSRLTSLSERTGTDLASLTASFFILHEITALVPLFFFVYLFGLLGIGESIYSWFSEAAAGEDEMSETTTLWNWRRKIGEWLDDGSTRFEKFARRKGWPGFEKGSHPKPHDEGGAISTAAGVQGSKIAELFANAIAAHVVTKALLVPRLLLSFYLSPAFARGVFGPLKRFFKGRAKGAKK